MDYGAFNDTTLVDEIRRLDEGVYLGVGTTATEDGGRSAPGHFALGRPDPTNGSAPKSDAVSAPVRGLPCRPHRSGVPGR